MGDERETNNGCDPQDIREQGPPRERPDTTIHNPPPPPPQQPPPKSD